MPTDWPALLPELIQDRLQGLTVRQSATKRGLPHGSVGRWLRRHDDSLRLESAKAESLSQASTATLAHVDEAEQAETPSASFSNTPSWLEKERAKAREMMGKTLSGDFDPSAQQAAMIKLALKDELEPETERNPYAGRAIEEMVERSLVLAVSIGGLPLVTRILRKLSQNETLDLGLDWAPSSNDALEAAQQLPSSLEATAPLVRESVEPLVPETTTKRYDVESIDG